jgi:hypothetical protein
MRIVFKINKIKIKCKYKQIKIKMIYFKNNKNIKIIKK